MRRETLPELPFAAWSASRVHFHVLCQILGKIRLALHPPINHWWHCALYVSPRGITTGAIPWGDAIFDLELDVGDHAIVIRHGDGRAARVGLAGRSIAETYLALVGALHDLGIHVAIRARPYKLDFDIPFAEDREHDAYDPGAVHRAWSVLEQIEPVLAEHRSSFVGKCSPVHFFWHSLDLAVTRFSGRRAPPLPAADGVTREAYSHEVISAGFWFGDAITPEPAFYAYAAPSPLGLDQQRLEPREATWKMVHGAPLALLRYEDARRYADPRAAILRFLESTYDTAARLALWNRRALERRSAAA